MKSRRFRALRLSISMLRPSLFMPAPIFIGFPLSRAITIPTNAISVKNDEPTTPISVYFSTIMLITDNRMFVTTLPALKVSVNVNEADWQKMLQMFDEHNKQILFRYRAS